MHPLPPPPSSTHQPSGQQPGPTRPSVAPIQEHPSGQVQGQDSQAVTQENAEGKKKRKHRGKKTRRNRKQSFAALSETSTAPSAIPDIMTTQNEPERSGSGLRSFYQLGDSRGNMSNTSIESDALLDHRDQPMMRPRRESRLGQNLFMGYKGGNSPKGEPTVSPRKEYMKTPMNGESSRRKPAHRNAYDYESGDDGQAANDQTPLLSRSMRNGHNAEQLEGGGIFGALRFAANQRRDSSSTISSRKRRTGMSRDNSFLRHEHTEYDVNNPPSVPPSPVLGAEVDDVMFPGIEFGLERSPSRANTFANDTVIDIDSKSRSMSAPGPEGRGASLPRSKTLPMSVEGDVCFPASGMSEIAEEDYASQGIGGPDSSGTKRRRRRMWPELSVLDEWSLSEKITLHQDRRTKKISEPVLVGGRLRPSGKGWHRTEEDAPFRYTYFNEEFESTIHAQTISDLVPPGSNFRELFIPDPPELEDESSSDEEDLQPTKLAETERLPGSPGTRGPTERTHHKGPASLLSDPNHRSGNASGRQSGQATPLEGKMSQSPKPKRYGPRPTFWLDVLCPTNEEMRVLTKAFGIHGLTAEDIMMQETREKVELFRNYYFINYRTFEQDQEDVDYLEPVNLYIIVFREGVLSFHFSQTPHPANVRRRIRQLKDYLILSSDWISYALIDDITDVFQPLIQFIEEEVDDIDEKILQLHSDTLNHSNSNNNAKGNRSINEKRSEAGEENSPGIDMLRQVGDCRKKVMGLYRLLGNKADVIKGFAKRCTEQWDVAPKSEIGLYLGDIQDHILTMTGNLTHYEKLLSRAHSNYLAQITIRMNERQEQSADILGKLTVLGTIVLPMNIICGMWGMNVKVPGQEVDSLTWFWCITAGLIMFAITCVIVAKRVYGIV